MNDQIGQKTRFPQIPYADLFYTMALLRRRPLLQENRLAFKASKDWTTAGYRASAT